MNTIIQQLIDRKSVRSYSEREIGDKEKKLILKAALQAPTAGNMTLYTILDITDKELKQQLSVTCDDQPFIATAKMVLIFCADYKRWYDLFCAKTDTVRTPDTGDLFLAQADALIAAQNAVVAAQSLGIGSCYIGDITENFEEHKKLLSLPQYVVPAAMVCFGYPTEQQLVRPKPNRFEIEDIVHKNGYDTKKSAMMERMLAEREAMSDEKLSDWIKRFCTRKWNSDFSIEMSRSCNAALSDWQSR